MDGCNQMIEKTLCTLYCYSNMIGDFFIDRCTFLGFFFFFF